MKANQTILPFNFNMGFTPALQSKLAVLNAIFDAQMPLLADKTFLSQSWLYKFTPSGIYSFT